MVKVKICGITNLADAEAATEFGADALGFVFYKGSPRYVTPEHAGAIIRRLPPFIQTVGVFVDEEPGFMKEIVSVSEVNTIQLHGDEAPDDYVLPLRMFKAVRVKNIDSLAIIEAFRNKASAFLLDTYSEGVLGGTGRVFNWDIAVEAKRYGPIILAGGLTPENVVEAVRHVRPYAVDVSSGVELSKGKKDIGKLKAFIERAKSA